MLATVVNGWPVTNESHIGMQVLHRALWRLLSASNKYFLSPVKENTSAMTLMGVWSAETSTTAGFCLM